MLKLPGKIPLRVHPLFLVLMVAIGWMNSQTLPGTAVWMAVIFISVLVHELGHALTALAFGQQAEVEFGALGGTTRRHGRHLKPWQDFLVVLNGPLAGLLLVGLVYTLRLYLVGQSIPMWTYALNVAFFVNLFWTAINLLPIQPLDGGHLFRIFLEGLFGIRGVKAAYVVSFLIAAAAGLYFIYMQAVIVGALLWMFAFNSFQLMTQIMAVRAQDQDKTLQRAFYDAEKKMQLGDFDEAYHEFQDLRTKTKEGVLFLAATENVAEIASMHERPKEVFELLSGREKYLSPEGFLLLHQSVYQLGDWGEAVGMGTRLFRYHPSPDTALINAQSHAMLGQVKEAVGWLETAIREGLDDLPHILGMKDFDAIRESASFQKLLMEVGNAK